MSLDLRDIERSVGADLVRRPLITSSINAALLRLYVENILSVSDDDDDLEVPAAVFNAAPTVSSDTRPSFASTTRTAATQTDSKGILSAQRPASLLENVLAVVIYFVTFLLRFVGVAETILWFVLAIFFKVFRLPRIYGFEKLLLDVRAMFLPHMTRHIQKTVRYHVQRDGSPVAPLEAFRRGMGPFSITIVQAAETLTRDTSATLRLFRYATQFPICYWTEDSATLVGRHEKFIRAVITESEDSRPNESVHVDLGWHIDIVEGTKFKIAVEFTRESPLATDVGAGNMAPPVRSVTRNCVQVELGMSSSTESIELLVKSMDQFAAVCEAAERGRRPFNGKRVSIYGIGLCISVALILFYEGLQGLVKPSADVLTLAVGAYTLWMTLGRSAALGEIEEETMLRINARENILLTYHGLAKIGPNVVNTSWIPETSRQDPSDNNPSDEAELKDGSISLEEAAVCLSMFDHFGHLIKWKGPKLKLTCYNMRIFKGRFGGNMGQILSCHRIGSLQRLSSIEENTSLERIGGAHNLPINESSRSLGLDLDDDIAQP